MTDEDPQYRAALAWLNGRINYERSTLPYGARNLKLDRMRELLARLDSPEASQQIVHIAGTKGKGSTAALLAGVLRAAGNSVGVFASPHVNDLRERFTIDGELCAREDFVRTIDLLRAVVRKMDEEASSSSRKRPTFFEIITAAALLLFQKEQVDYTILEVGLGGRLDSTNVCMPLVSVITNIGYDHMRQLGNTLREIAWEKAGIITPGVPVVSGVVGEEPRLVIEQVAEERGSPLIQLGRDFRYRFPAAGVEQTKSGTLFQPATLDFDYQMESTRWSATSLRLAQPGDHQSANAAVALAALTQLKRFAPPAPIDAQIIRQGLQSPSLPGRLEIVANEPTVLIDAAHNVASVRALADVLKASSPSGTRTLIFATSRDKDICGMLEILMPNFPRLIITRYVENPRAADPRRLAEICQSICLPRGDNEAERGGRQPEVLVATSPSAAWKLAAKELAAEDLIVIAGSFFTAAEFRKLAVSRPLLVSSKPALAPGMPCDPRSSK